eukprot:m.673025 g.673025  ORF g.673025 m.673025 type:complete len:97 (+) comp58537_c0_seq26:1100-1390(+)
MLRRAAGFDSVSLYKNRSTLGLIFCAQLGLGDALARQDHRLLSFLKSCLAEKPEADVSVRSVFQQSEQAIWVSQVRRPHERSVAVLDAATSSAERS